jgi:bifunctional non-homologous end joining protein LigD
MPRSRKKPSPPLEETGAHRAELPAAIAPQLATLVSAVPTLGEWSYEIKFDGYRLMVRLQAGKPTLITRGGHDWTDRMKDLQKSLSGLPADTAWLDGEVVGVEFRRSARFQRAAERL